MERKIKFYETENNKISVKDFMDSLELNIVQKILWTLKLINENDRVPKKYFKKLDNTDDIWEVRVKVSSDIFRVFSFWDKGNLIILTHGIQKKTQKTPKNEIKLAEKYKKDYFRRKK